MAAFRFLTAGESHGPALGVTIEGVPAGLALTADEPRGRPRPAPEGLRPRRAPGDRAGPGGDPRRRPPRLTLGSPILLLVRNRDWENWTQVMAVEPLDEAAAAALHDAAEDGNKRATPVTRVRPGHADLAGALKYGFNDVRNVLERASARETAARVAAGGVARAFLRELGIETLVVHRRGRRRGGRPGELHAARATRRTRRRCAAPTRTPRPR